MGAVTIVAFGGGTDSTAMLVEMVNRREPRPYAILFADTGGEHPHTYRHVEQFSRWLADRQYPEITILRVKRETLEDACLRTGTVPSVAFGYKTCSQRFKGDPQKKWANNDPKCREEWAAGRTVQKLIGFELGEEHRVTIGDKKYTNRYPLIEWEMDRDACKKVIEAAGLRLPGKSSCFFCPNSKKHEIRALQDTYPELLARALAMEDKARPNFGSIAGLGRRFSWRDYIEGRATAPELPMDMPCECYDGAAS